jgi:hypothetical protein
MKGAALSLYYQEGEVGSHASSNDSKKAWAFLIFLYLSYTNTHAFPPQVSRMTGALFRHQYLTKYWLITVLMQTPSRSILYASILSNFHMYFCNIVYVHHYDNIIKCILYYGEKG